jgi:hypothetical protein
MLLITGLILFGLGIAVWLYGNRMWLLGAGAGALLGMALLKLIPALTTGGLDLLIVGGLAILFGVLGFIGKAFAKIIAMVIGFIAGGAIMLGFLDILGLTSVGFWAWILAVIGGLIGAVLFARFLDWALIIFASLLGSMLVVRGAMAAVFPSLVGTFGTLIVVALTAAGIYYHYRKNAPKTASTAK